MQGEIIAGGTIIGGMIGQRGAPGNGIASIEKTGESGLVETYTITFTNGETFDFEITNGAKGDTGEQGEQGIPGITPNFSIGSVTKGADASATISGTTEAPILNLVLPKGDKGDTGNTGATPSFSIGSVSTGTPSSVTITGTTENPVLNFVLEQGETGATGATGNGISTIAKTSASGNVDTYTITYTSGSTTTFNVTNANVVNETSSSTGNTYSCEFINDLVGDIESLLETLDVGDGV